MGKTREQMVREHVEARPELARLLDECDLIRVGFVGLASRMLREDDPAMIELLAAEVAARALSAARAARTKRMLLADAARQVAADQPTVPDQTWKALAGSVLPRPERPILW
jgi:hypothetical protein